MCWHLGTLTGSETPLPLFGKKSNIFRLFKKRASSSSLVKIGFGSHRVRISALASSWAWADTAGRLKGHLMMHWQLTLFVSQLCLLGQKGLIRGAQHRKIHKCKLHLALNCFPSLYWGYRKFHVIKYCMRPQGSLATATRVVEHKLQA